MGSKAVTTEAHNSSIFPLFDEQFTIKDFSNAIDDAEKEAESIFSAARKAAQKAFQQDEDTRYVVDMEPEIKDKLQRGEIELVVENGKTFAQLRTEKKKYSKKLPITEELKEEGISQEALQMAIQMEAIKAQLQTIIENIKNVEERVVEVTQGQRNDRIGLLYSGLSLYMECRNIKDDYLRKQIAAQALKTISDANSQMVQDLRQSISYLVTEQYKKAKKMTDKINEHLGIIHQCYDVVYRAAFLKAIIYQEAGEVAAMLLAIEEYGRFIEKLIVPYVGKLSELDSTNKFIEKGTWGRIANTLGECQNLRFQIENSTSYSFLLGGDINGEEG